MAEDDEDFGLGDDFDDLDDLDDFDDDDRDRGAAVVMCRVNTVSLRFTFVDNLAAAMQLAAERCGVDGCVGDHAVAFRDANRRIRIRPGPSTNLAVPRLSAAMSARLRDPRVEKRRRQRIEANEKRRQRRNKAKQQQKETDD